MAMLLPCVAEAQMAGFVLGDCGGEAWLAMPLVDVGAGWQQQLGWTTGEPQQQQQQQQQPLDGWTAAGPQQPIDGWTASGPQQQQQQLGCWTGPGPQPQQQQQLDGWMTCGQQPQQLVACAWQWGDGSLGEQRWEDWTACGWNEPEAAGSGGKRARRKRRCGQKSMGEAAAVGARQTSGGASEDSTDADSTASSPSSAASAPPPAFLGDETLAALALADSPELCGEVLARLVPEDPEKDAVLAWVLRDACELALAPSSCRVVQRLLEVVGGPGRDELARALGPRTVKLYESPHGNHVLTKLVEVMPSASLRPVIEKIEQRGYLTVAKHQFGCRVLERLIEHSTEREMSRLNDGFVASAEQLCRHPYGNFVVQHLLEHGAGHRGAEIVQRLLPTIPQLATHRVASHVVQAALTYASDEGQRAIVAGLLGGGLLDVAASRYGSYVVEDLQGLRCSGGEGLGAEVRRRLGAAGPEHLASAHFARVAERFGLACAAPAPQT